MANAPLIEYTLEWLATNNVEEVRKLRRSFILSNVFQFMQCPDHRDQA